MNRPVGSGGFDNQESDRGTRNMTCGVDGEATFRASSVLETRVSVAGTTGERAVDDVVAIIGVPNYGTWSIVVPGLLVVAWIIRVKGA